MAISLRKLAPAMLLALTLPLAPVAAKVSSVAPNGLSVVHLATIEASPADLWNVLVEPSLWWNPEHSFTGEAIYLTLDAKPNGCFCETIPAGETAGGGIAHFTVVYVDRPRVLRMQGALGPLQSEAVSGTMTIAMEPGEDGTSKISLSYVVGGYIRTPVADMARSLDQITGEALARLKATAEGRDPASAVFVAEPFPAARSDGPDQAIPEDLSEKDEKPAARPSLSERLELPEDEEDIELAGSDSRAEDTEAEPDADADADTQEETENPRTPRLLPDGSR